MKATYTATVRCKIELNKIRVAIEWKRLKVVGCWLLKMFEAENDSKINFKNFQKHNHLLNSSTFYDSFKKFEFD